MISDPEAPLWVWVYLPYAVDPVLCGRFELTAGAAGALGTFVYGRRYLERADAVAIDPVLLPLQAKKFSTTALGGWFSVLIDAGPDAWGQRLIDKAVGPQSQIGYLLHARGQTVGALAFSSSPEEPPVQAASTTPATLADTLALHARLEAGEVLTPEENSRLLLEAGSGGARPKLTLWEGDTLWLAKGVSLRDNPDLAPVPCAEATLLTLADACGIRVPRHDVREVSGRPVLLVERFDREAVEGGVARWRYASAQTLFWSRPDITSTVLQGSYTNLARHLRIWERLPGADLRELYRRLVFNALVGNTDDHDRNHGVIANEMDDFVLSPAFDLTICATPGRRQHLSMAFGVDGALISIPNLVSETQSFGYSQPDALALVHEQWRVIAGTSLETLVATGCREDLAAATLARMPGHRLLGDAP